MEENEKIISRDEAKSLGLARYFDNKVCVRGHLDQKYVANGRCVECSRLSKNRWYAINRDNVVKDNQTRYREDREYKDRCKKYEKDYINRVGIDNFRKRRAKYTRDRRANNPVARLDNSMRNSLRKTLKSIGGKKEASVREYLGYSPLELKKHLESNFLDGMTFSNLGEVWNIDHHVPIYKFAMDGEDRVNEINALSNLFPMFCEDNFSKSNKDWSDWAEMYPERAKLYEKQKRPVY